MNRQQNEMKVIQLGQVWMKNSINGRHDYRHAEEVAGHSGAIYKSLQEGGVALGGLNENLAVIPAWWHDSYKSRMARSSLWAVLFEGFESEKIVRTELKEYLSTKQLNLVAQAVRYHNHPVWYFVLNRRKYTPLIQILYEADHLDALRKERFVGAFNLEGSWLGNLLYGLYYVRVQFLMKLLPKSDYTKKQLAKIKL